MKPLYKQYENAAPIGLYTLCNFGGLAILYIDESAETATAAFHWGEKYESIRRHQIHYTYTGRAYIRKGGRRYYFDQIIRRGGFNND